MIHLGSLVELFMIKKIIVYTDGASRGNPGRSGWGAVVVDPEGYTWELGNAKKHSTNNAMELSAIAAALQTILNNPTLSNTLKHDSQILIHSDSSYALNGIQYWVSGWQRRDWKTKEGTPIKNKEIWQEILRLQKEVGAKKIQWIHVSGHAGIPGNERCDKIATDFADGVTPDLYNGPTKDYSVDTTPPSSADLEKASARKKKKKSKKGGYYLSFVHGQCRVHKTWGECEQIVKGVRGAKFQKVADAEEEAEVRAKWGVS